MRTDSEKDEDDRSGVTDESVPRARLVREQAASIAHYKKMYDRASALARIGVWECDLASGALTWTDGVYDLFELPRGAPLDRARIVALYDEESRREMERLRAAAITEGSGFSLDIRIRTARGNERWLRLTADIEQENKRAVRIFGTKQDITQAKAAQAEVRALQAELIQVSRRSAMGVMAATLAHELNQPLTAISNYAAGLRRALERAAPAARSSRAASRRSKGAPSAPAASSAACATSPTAARWRASRSIRTRCSARPGRWRRAGRPIASPSLTIWPKASRCWPIRSRSSRSSST